MRFAASRVSPTCGAAPQPSPVIGNKNYRSDAVRGGLNVTVRVKPTALPLNISLLMPRYGSSENVAIMVAAGLWR